MILFLLAACSGGGASSKAGLIDTSKLWTVEDGRFQEYRVLDAGAKPEADTATLDLTLQAEINSGGCADESGWRMELREGDAWATAETKGALHFTDANGLALCGYEDASGTLTAFTPPVDLWLTGDSLQSGADLVSGDWTVGPEKETDLVTYYGVFPTAVRFTLDGTGSDPSGWALTFAPDAGPVLIENSNYTADLIYYR